MYSLAYLVYGAVSRDFLLLLYSCYYPNLPLPPDKQAKTILDLVMTLIILI